jgi:hypothetical protein
LQDLVRGKLDRGVKLKTSIQERKKIAEQAKPCQLAASMVLGSTERREEFDTGLQDMRQVLHYAAPTGKRVLISPPGSIKCHKIRALISRYVEFARLKL